MIDYEKLKERTEIRQDGNAEFRRDDPIFYHPELDILLCFGQFVVLLPEKYGWVEIGEL